MAAPLSADRFLAALRAEGVRVVEYDGWRTHNRNSKGPWGPVHGVIVHHTVTSGSANTVRICRDGYSGLPGPLCQGVITKDGTFHLIGYGRANHAGGGDPDVLAAVQSESYGDRPPVPNVGNDDGIDGNARYYGWECENLGDGKDPWPAVQLDTIERASAAVCRAHGWSAKSVIGHLEWSDDKTDPRGFSMTAMRARVAARLGGATNPPTSEEDDMPTPADLWNFKVKAPAGRQVSAADILGYSDARHDVIYREIVAVKTQITGLTATVQTLAGLLGQHDDVDTAKVVAAVERAIAAAVVNVDVTVTGADAT